MRPIDFILNPRNISIGISFNIDGECPYILALEIPFITLLIYKHRNWNV